MTSFILLVVALMAFIDVVASNDVVECSEEAGVISLKLVIDPRSGLTHEVPLAHNGRASLLQDFSTSQENLRAEFREMCASFIVDMKPAWGVSECAAVMLDQISAYVNECQNSPEVVEEKSDKDKSGALNDDFDIQFIVSSPAQDATFYLSKFLASDIMPVVDIVLGSGPWTDAVQSQPELFELCITWDATEIPANYTCHSLVGGSTIGPNLNVAAAPAGAHVFSVHLQHTAQQQTTADLTNAGVSFAEWPTSVLPSKRVDYFTTYAWRRENEGKGAPRTYATPPGNCFSATAEGASVSCSIRWVDPALWHSEVTATNAKRNSSHRELERSPSHQDKIIQAEMDWATWSEAQASPGLYAEIGQAPVTVVATMCEHYGPERCSRYKWAASSALCQGLAWPCPLAELPVARRTLLWRIKFDTTSVKDSCASHIFPSLAQPNGGISLEDTEDDGSTLGVSMKAGGLKVTYDAHDDPKDLGRFICLALALPPVACRAAWIDAESHVHALRYASSLPLSQSVSVSKNGEENTSEDFHQSNNSLHQNERVWLPQRACPAAQRRRQQWASLREALEPSTVARCAQPRFESQPDLLSGGAHWTARPVGACLFEGLVLLDGEFHFLIDSSSHVVRKSDPANDTIAAENSTRKGDDQEVLLPLARMSAFDWTATTGCGPVEARGDHPRFGSSPTPSEAARELWNMQVVEMDALAAWLLVEGRPLAGLGQRGQGEGSSSSSSGRKRRERRSTNNTSINSRNNSHFDESRGHKISTSMPTDDDDDTFSNDNGTTEDKDSDAGLVVLPVRRIHIHNHGHTFEDGVQPLHWALSLLGLGSSAAQRSTLVLFADDSGPGIYDDRFRLISRSPPVHLSSIRDNGLQVSWLEDVPSSSRRSSGRRGTLDAAACNVPNAACVLAQTAVGIGGLGFHGCEYGLHPDTFNERRDAFIDFRATALNALGVSNHVISAYETKNDNENPDAPLNSQNESLESTATATEASNELYGDVDVVRVLVVQRGDDRHIRNLPELAAAFAAITRGSINAQNLNPAIGGNDFDGKALARPFRVAVECLCFDAMPLTDQLRSLSATHVLVAVDGTALDNAPLAMPQGGGVVALGRICQNGQACPWYCACFTLGYPQTQSEVDALRERLPKSSKQSDHALHSNTSANSATSRLDARTSVASGMQSELCSADYSFRLCGELWRPFIQTSYLDADPSLEPYTIDVNAAVELVRQHAKRLVDDASRNKAFVASKKSGEEAARGVAERRNGFLWGDDVAAAVASANTETMGRVQYLVI